MGAPKGNNNAGKNKPWQDALRRALARKGGSVEKGLSKVADQLVIAATHGEQWAIREIGDRLDGKPAQQQIITGDEDGGALALVTMTAEEYKRARTGMLADDDC